MVVKVLELCRKTGLAFDINSLGLFGFKYFLRRHKAMFKFLYIRLIKYGKCSSGNF